jgi:Asp-tRNA(Asn)/Glu-tRNA(Gln) amidotransferase A subunit family amidase
MITSTHVAVSIENRIAAVGREPGADDLEPMTLAQLMAARGRGALDYVRAVQAMHRIGRAMGALFTQVDVVVTPTLGTVPLPLGELCPNVDDLASFGALAGRVSQFLGVFNATGQPAMSLPLHWSDAGLPIGVQIIGRFGAEATLLALGRRLEETAPWWHRTAPVVD